MARIPLRNARREVIAWTVVDDGYFDWLNQWHWSLSPGSRGGYARRMQQPNHIQMHRQIMGCEPKDGQIVDHINGDKLDNRRSNLRLASHRLNALNMKAKGRSGYTGVSWNTTHGKWVVRMRVQGRETYFGSFTDLKEAARVAKDVRERVIADEARRMVA